MPWFLNRGNLCPSCRLVVLMNRWRASLLACETAHPWSWIFRDNNERPSTNMLCYMWYSSSCPEGFQMNVKTHAVVGRLPQHCGDDINFSRYHFYSELCGRAHELAVALLTLIPDSESSSRYSTSYGWCVSTVLYCTQSFARTPIRERYWDLNPQQQRRNDYLRNWW